MLLDHYRHPNGEGKSILSVSLFPPRGGLLNVLYRGGGRSHVLQLRCRRCIVRTVNSNATALESMHDGSSTDTDDDFDSSDISTGSKSASSCPGSLPGVRRRVLLSFPVSLSRANVVNRSGPVLLKGHSSYLQGADNSRVRPIGTGCTESRVHKDNPEFTLVLRSGAVHGCLSLYFCTKTTFGLTPLIFAELCYKCFMVKVYISNCFCLPCAK